MSPGLATSDWDGKLDDIEIEFGGEQPRNVGDALFNTAKWYEFE
jgi:hypothetical protein